MSLKNHQDQCLGETKPLNVKCDYCDKVFQDHADIQPHYQDCHPNRPIVLDGITKLICMKCKELFFGKKSYNAHKCIQEKFEKKKIKCDYCDKLFPKTLQIKQHYKAHHPGLPIILPNVTKYNCDKCHDLFFTKQYLREHKCQQRYEQECQLCQVPFSNRNEYVQHMQQFHPSEKVLGDNRYDLVFINSHHRNRKCDYCDFEFKDTVGIKVHYVMNHPDKPIMLDNLKRFHCLQCEDFFFNEVDLTQHRNDNHKFQANPKCDICKVDFIDWNVLQQHNNEVHQPGYPCEFCGRKMISKEFLASHERKCDPVTEGQQGKVKCDKCDKGVEYNSAKKLQRHIDLWHTPMTCEVCGIQYNNSRTLGMHLRRNHKNENHTCVQCNKTFESETKYKHHMSQSHMKVNCDICYKEVLNNFFLKRHKVLDHGIEDGAMFCPICPKSKFVCFKKFVFNKHLKDKHNLQSAE